MLPSKYLSANQISKLSIVGIKSIYELITLLPTGIEEILPLERNTQITDKIKYNWRAELINFQKKQGTRAVYWLLEFRSEGRLISVYYFANTSFTQSTLKIGGYYNLVLTCKDRLWSLDKIKPATELEIQKEITKIIRTKYAKIGFLQSAFFEQIHKQLPPEIYALDLQGLVPQNDIIPQTLNLSKIHKPRSKQEYFDCLNQWIALKVFLKVSLIKFLEVSKEQKKARAAILDLGFLKELSANLPFQLSVSQKTTIWELLGDICVD
jgi:RecG-like helicase